MITLGDLTVHDELVPLPGKLAKAFAVIAAHLHPRLAIEGLKSKNQCILCALTVRDFLHNIGFRDAHVLSCVFMVKAFRGDEMVHSLGIGMSHYEEPKPGFWKGHLVVVIPKSAWLIDPTMFTAMRAQWPMVSGMGAAALTVPRIPKSGQRIVAGFSYRNGESRVSAAWWCRHNLQWRHAPDSIPARREYVVSFLTHAFGDWRDDETDRGESRGDALSGVGRADPIPAPDTLAQTGE